MPVLLLMLTWTHSWAMFNSLADASGNVNALQRLLINLYLLYKSYELCEISEIAWVPSDQNPANALTKQNDSRVLKTLLKNSQIKVDAKVWAECLQLLEKSSKVWRTLVKLEKRLRPVRTSVTPFCLSGYFCFTFNTTWGYSQAEHPYARL